jgi:hypothetical protein
MAWRLAACQFKNVKLALPIIGTFGIGRVLVKPVHWKRAVRGNRIDQPLRTPPAPDGQKLLAASFSDVVSPVGNLMQINLQHFVGNSSTAKSRPRIKIVAD